jgi:fucose permease
LLFGYGPFESGLRMLPFIPVMIVMTTASPRLVERFGTRIVVSVGMVITGVGVLLLSGLNAASSYGEVLVGMFVMAAGMGLTMTPMTDLIMSSVPRDKAGVGSAMNDTTRELGGALGVAVLGSLVASRYDDRLRPAIDLITPELRGKAQESLAGALQAAKQMNSADSADVVRIAREAYVSGMHLAAVIGGTVALCAAVIVYRKLPTGNPHARAAMTSAELHA